MIKTIQVAEAKAWGAFRNAQKEFGSDDSITARLRMQWHATYELMAEMGIAAMSTGELMQHGLYPQVA